MHVDDCPDQVFRCAGLDETTEGRAPVEPQDGCSGHGCGHDVTPLNYRMHSNGQPMSYPIQAEVSITHISSDPCDRGSW